MKVILCFFSFILSVNILNAGSIPAIDRIFEIHDLNGDFYLDRSELKSVLNDNINWPGLEICSDFQQISESLKLSLFYYMVSKAKVPKPSELIYFHLFGSNRKFKYTDKIQFAYVLGFVYGCAKD